MGTFAAKLKIWNPNDPDRSDHIELLVDTGASFSWIARARMEALGVLPTGQMQFRTIEGHLVERQIAPVYAAYDGYTGTSMVVLAEPGDLEVMGAHTLESLGLAADAMQKKLVRTIGLALAAGLGERKSRLWRRK